MLMCLQTVYTLNALSKKHIRGYKIALWPNNKLLDDTLRHSESVSYTVGSG